MSRPLTSSSSRMRSAECGQRSLDQIDDLGGVRLNFRTEAVDLAGGCDNELLEVPLHLAGIALSVRRPGQLGIQRMLRASVHPDLLEHRKCHAIGLRAERRDRLGAVEL